MDYTKPKYRIGDQVIFGEIKRMGIVKGAEYSDKSWMYLVSTQFPVLKGKKLIQDTVLSVVNESFISQ